MCADGKYLGSNKYTCYDCPAGYTCAGRTWNTLITVSTGYYSPVGISAEFICPAGYDCSLNYLTACTDGWFSIETALTCTICPVNWACPNKEMDYTDQIYCPNQRGMWNPNTAATECIIADAGYYIEYGDLTPTQCQEGTWSAGAARACHECPPGYICPSKVQPEMYKCEVGSYALNYNQITCDTCETGYYCDGESRGACPTYKYSYAGWGICRFAPAGYYLVDQTEIYLCPSGTYAIFGSGDSSLGSATCETCPVGHSCNVAS